MATPDPLKEAALADINKAKGWWAKYGHYVVLALVALAAGYLGHKL